MNGSSSGPVREAASDAAEAVLSIINPLAVPGLVVPVVSDNIAVDDIQNYLVNCNQDFEASQLYSSLRNEKFTDK
jgi:hypothetical protein